MRFINTSYERTDYYNKKHAVKWDFKHALLEKKDINGISYLTGNIQLYSPRTKEPEKPMYVTLQQDLSENQNFTNNQKITNSRLIVYPNPFDSELNLLFDLASSSNVIAEIYGTNGVRYVHTDFGQLDAGRHNYILDINIPKGQYIFTLKKGSSVHSEIINKK